MSLGSWSAVAALFVSGTVTFGADLDRDGLADDLEQTLLERFQPSFFISAGECDSLPAEFQSNTDHPVAIHQNGTIYGQAFPHEVTGRTRLVEMHYYHLWRRDCGRQSHDLDAEHVSVLLTANGAGERVENWTAVYWYAAGHEGTICDSGHGLRASALHAEQSGPKVWISRGKHASFLTLERCLRGCGSDHCEMPVRIAPPRVINLGELAFPMNGATWIRSDQWPLASKMGHDFNSAVIQRMGDSDHEILFRTHLGAPQSVVSAGNRTIDGLLTSDQNTALSLTTAAFRTDAALDATEVNTADALVEAIQSTSDALGRTGSAVRGALQRTTKFVSRRYRTNDNPSQTSSARRTAVVD